MTWVTATRLGVLQRDGEFHSAYRLVASCIHVCSNSFAYANLCWLTVGYTMICKLLWLVQNSISRMTMR